MLKFLDKFEEGYPKVNNFVLLLFCGYVIIWYLQIGYRVSALGAIRIEFIWALLLTAIALLSPDKPNYLRNPLTSIVILFFLSMAIQVPFSQVPEHSWNIFYNRVIKFAFMAFFIVSFVRSPKGLILFIFVFMLACMKMGQEGFVGQLSGSMVWQNQGIMRLHGSTPLYTHPNSFAGMALGTIPFILYLFPIVPKIFKVALIVQFIFACNIILHTGSRTGYVAFLLMLVFVFIFSRKKVAAIAMIVLFSIVAINFIDEQYIARFNTIVTGEEIEGNSIGARKQILEDAVQVFISHPFGVGVSAFPAVRSSMFNRSADTHNLYLEVATNLGIQGLIIFVIFIYKLLGTLLKVRKIATSKKDKLLSMLDKGITDNKNKKYIADLNLIIALSYAVFLFIIVRLTLGLFGMDLYEIYWWFSLGITIALSNIQSSINTENWSYKASSEPEDSPKEKRKKYRYH